jgi:hypothetical protein
MSGHPHLLHAPYSTIIIPFLYSRVVLHSNSQQGHFRFTYTSRNHSRTSFTSVLPYGRNDIFIKSSFRDPGTPVTIELLSHPDTPRYEQNFPYMNIVDISPLGIVTVHAHDPNLPPYGSTPVIDYYTTFEEMSWNSLNL